MVLVFDLDDTLFDEESFVYSGFSAVSEYLSINYSCDRAKLFYDLKQELRNGRGSVFDIVLRRHDLFSKGLVKKCLAIYRMHKPNIHVYDDALECLRRFHNISKYIVTDGNKIVQKNKIDALKIEKYFSFCFITRRYGTKNEKPSPYCFQKICKIEGTGPEEVVYIGDNPAKDFIGIKPLGFKTIRIMKGNHRDVVKSKDYEAHVQIDSLSELSFDLINQMLTRKLD